MPRLDFELHTTKVFDKYFHVPTSLFACPARNALGLADCPRDRIFLAICKQLAHYPAVPGAIDHSLGMFPPKSLRDVTAPAHRKIRCKDFRQRLRGNVAPLRCLSVSSQQRRPVIVPIELTKCLVAIGTRTASIPVNYFRPNEAVMRIRPQLRQALLPTTLPLRPAGTFAQVDFRSAAQRAPCRVGRRHLHANCLASFGTGKKHLPPIPEQHARCVDEPGECCRHN
jgi:hypothetical protein